ncbi:hypothetical protein JCM3770_000200 [Rhodotorula araucariae]
MSNEIFCGSAYSPYGHLPNNNLWWSGATGSSSTGTSLEPAFASSNDPLVPLLPPLFVDNMLTAPTSDAYMRAENSNDSSSATPFAYTADTIMIGTSVAAMPSPAGLTDSALATSAWAFAPTLDPVLYLAPSATTAGPGAPCDDALPSFAASYMSASPDIEMEALKAFLADLPDPAPMDVDGAGADASRTEAPASPIVDDDEMSPASSSRSLAPTLSGDTPCPSRPLSVLEKDEVWDGPTRVGSPAPFDDDEGMKAKTSTWDAEKGYELQEQAGEERPEETAADFPEGGLRAWLCVLGSTLVLLCTFGLSNSFGTFLQYYHTHQLAAYTTSEISWIGSAHLFITFSCAFGAGVAFDRGFFRYQLALGSIAWLGGVFGLSFARTFAQIFVCQAVVMGLALGSFFAPCLSILGTYFRRRRAFVVGVAASGTAVGASIFPVLLGQLFDKKGFAWAIRAAGFLMLGLLVVANLVIRPRKLTSHVPPASARPSSAQVPLGTVLGKIIRQPSAWLVYCGVFGIYVSCFIPLFYVVSFAKTFADNDAVATYSLSIINAVAFFSRIGSGLVADRLGIFNTAVPLGALVAALTFAMMGATSTASLSVWLVLFGFAQGGWISISASCFMSLADDASEIGLRSGLGFLFVALATLIGSPIAGALLAATGGSYVAALCFGAGMAVAGCGLLVLGRRTQVRRRGSQWV